MVVAQEYQNEIAPTFTYSKSPKTPEKLQKIVCLLMICFCRLPANTLYVIIKINQVIILIEFLLLLMWLVAIGEPSIII